MTIPPNPQRPEVNTTTDVVIPISMNGGRGNAIGTPGGAYGFHMQFARMLHPLNGGGHGSINPIHQPILEHTHPAVLLPEHPNWKTSGDIISFHARGHRAAMENLHLTEGHWFLPTISISETHFGRPNILEAIQKGRLKPDGKVLFEDGSYKVTDINIDPVWHLDRIAERIGIDRMQLRNKLYGITQNWDLIARPEAPFFLPPIDGPNIHIFGDVQRLADPNAPKIARTHDFCRDGDNYALRCTCAPFRDFAIEYMLRNATEEGGVGILALYPEEGRNLGSVIKHLVYNRRARRPEGDLPELYMQTTNDVAGGEDARMHWTKSDVYKWLLGPEPHIKYWLSENPHKKKALETQGITVEHIVELPKDRIHPRAFVEINAKRVHSGYKGTPIIHGDENFFEAGVVSL